MPSTPQSRAKQLDKPQEIKGDKVRFCAIVPECNVENFFGECLASIARQDHFEYEVVIVDDGSTNGISEGYVQLAEQVQ